MAGSTVEDQQCNDRVALLVLGMHRSGTSAVTRVVSLLGADLPKDLMEPSAGENEPGFWESWDLYYLQEELLAAVDSTWDDWRPFNPDWLDSPTTRPIINRIVEYLQSDFDGSPLFVVKDPRICRLMPLWRDILDSMGVATRVLLPVRNPLEVAKSLYKRNGISLARAYIIWLRHVLDAEHNSRDIPRLVFAYDDLLHDWKAFASQASQALGISWPADSEQTTATIDDFLKPGHRHHAFDETQLLSHASVSDWVKQTYSALNILMKDATSEKAFRLLDKVRAEFDQAGNIFGEIIASEETAAQELRARLVLSENMCKWQETKIGEMETRFATLQAELESSHTAFRRQMTNATRLQQKLTALKSNRGSDREVLVSQIEKEKVFSEHSATQRSNLLNRLNGIQISSTWRLAESMYLFEAHSPRLIRLLAAASIALRGLASLHPIKYWQPHWDARIVQNSGLFDWDWYIEGNSDVVAAGVDPLKHWLSTGWKEGRKPNPYFDTSWYVEQYLSNSSDTPNPLLHYIQEYENRDLEPNSDFNTKQYLLQHPEVGQDGINPLAHLLSNHIDSPKKL